LSVAKDNATRAIVVATRAKDNATHYITILPFQGKVFKKVTTGDRKVCNSVQRLEKSSLRD
jgi:hypothetical protein